MSIKTAIFIAFLTLLPTSAFAAGHNYCADATTAGCWRMDHANNMIDYSASGSNLDYAPHFTTPRRPSGSLRYTFTADIVPSGYYGFSQKFWDTSLLDTSTSPAALNINGASAVISVASWVRLTSGVSDTTTPFILGKHRASSAQGQYALQAVGKSSTAFSFRFSVSPNGSDITYVESTAANYAKNTWYHVAAVYNGTDLRLYVNGVLASTPVAYTSGLYNSTARFGLGNISGAPLTSNQFYGYMDEVIVSSSALSASDILALYTTGIDGQKGALDEDNFTRYISPNGVILTLDQIYTKMDELLAANPTWIGEVLPYKTAQGRDIRSIIIPNTAALTQVVAIDANMHGSEKLPSLSALAFMDYLAAHPSAFPTVKFVVTPVVSPDAQVASTRINANGVNVNRNFNAGWTSASEDDGYGTLDYPGPYPASENDTKAYMYLMRKYKPNKIMTWHTRAQCFLRSTNYDDTTILAINSYLTSNGFAEFDNSTSGTYPDATTKSWGHQQGAETYTVEAKDSEDTYNNIQEINRAIGAIIAFTNNEIRRGWNPQKRTTPIL